MTDKEAAEVLRRLDLRYCAPDEEDSFALLRGAEALENRDAWETERDFCRAERDAARRRVNGLEAESEVLQGAIARHLASIDLIRSREEGLLRSLRWIAFGYGEPISDGSPVTGRGV